MPGCEDGAGVGGGVGAGVGHRGGGRLDDGVVGGGQGGDFVNGVVVVSLEADLAAKRPCTLDPGIVSEGAEQLVGGRCKVLVDGVFLSDVVGLEVGGGGQSIFFVFKDESADVFGE